MINKRLSILALLTFYLFSLASCVFIRDSGPDFSIAEESYDWFIDNIYETRKDDFKALSDVLIENQDTYIYAKWKSDLTFDVYLCEQYSTKGYRDEMLLSEHQISSIIDIDFIRLILCPQTYSDTLVTGFLSFSSGPEQLGVVYDLKVKTYGARLYFSPDGNELPKSSNLKERKVNWVDDNWYIELYLHKAN